VRSALAGAGAVALCFGAARSPSLLFQTITPNRSPPPTHGAGSKAGSGAGSAGSTLASGAAVAALSMSAAVVLSSSRKQKTSTVRYAEVAETEEKPFAGGLIGGQSAFSSFDYNFDPLGLSERVPHFLPWFREAELKHGRICMMAWVGLVIPDILRIPGPDACYKASIVEAHNACIGKDPQTGPLFQVFLFVGLIEMLTTYPKVAEGLTLENAGDYQLGLGFLPKEEDKITEMKLKELKNGRLAMLAFGGAITQATLSGNGFPWLYATRPEQTFTGMGSSIAPAMKTKRATALCAEGENSSAPYEMSTAVPFLPLSPALKGMIGEEEGFDPMGFSLAYDIRWLREAELKHGRVCMLATVGWIATDLGMRVPGPMFNVSTIEAHDAMVKFGAMPQMLVWIGYAEVFGFLAITNMLEGATDRAPGDFGIRVLYPKDEAGQRDMQKKELKNGRLAMLAFSGIVTSAVLTGKTWPFFAVSPEKTAANQRSTLCGASMQSRTSDCSVRALETSASLPFLPKPKNLEGWVGAEQEFDPIGFSDNFDMNWLRESELKHGRVCMLATVGFVAQQYITIPGMTPQADSLNAIYTAPAAGLITLLFFAGYVESSSTGGKMTMLDMFDGTGKVPGDMNFGSGFLNGKSEQEVYDMKLKELNNGRLAMLAFSGMVHHNLVVKGPLFPLFPEGWTGPQGSWEVESVVGKIITGQIGNEVVP